MIRWVAEACEKSRADEIIVATDYAQVVDAVSGMKRATAVLTRVDHASGTDRVAEVARGRKWPMSAVVVNVQGDEPNIPPALIDQVASLLQDNEHADLATLYTPIASLSEFIDPNVVKVVCSANGIALYFSRAPIPWNRDTAASLATQREFPESNRHIGIYAYRVGSLFKMTELAQSKLEKIEKLEQLRALEAGMQIVAARAVVLPGSGVDTAEDLEQVRSVHAQN